MLAITEQKKRPTKWAVDLKFLAVTSWLAEPLQPVLSQPVLWQRPVPPCPPSWRLLRAQPPLPQVPRQLLRRVLLQLLRQQ
jgi:hypothetical protein